VLGHKGNSVELGAGDGFLCFLLDVRGMNILSRGFFTLCFQEFSNTLSKGIVHLQIDMRILASYLKDKFPPHVRVVENSNTRRDHEMSSSLFTTD